MLSAKKSAAPSDDTLYIEDVFSTYLYTGNGSTQTITNGIDLAGEGGLVWLTTRTPLASGYSHQLFDTARGSSGGALRSNETSAQNNQNNHVSSFLSSGFTLGNGNGSGIFANYPASPNNNYVSWTFRKAPEFFDVVTYTGTGVARTISHNLGVAPGIIITKRTDVAGDDWATYHRSLGASSYISLNTTGASQATSTGWNDTAPTSTGFSLGTSSLANANGGSYVAYLFAHDTTSTGMIQCDSFTTDGGGNATVSLGWEPQWLLVKKSGSTSGGVDDRWHIYDTMRGIPVGAVEQVLDPNNTNAEYTTNWLEINATGFSAVNYNLTASKTYIYLAIRRGPMKTPTTGTQVYNAVAYSGNGSARSITGAGFAPDTVLTMMRTSLLGPSDYSKWFFDRIRGYGTYLNTASTNAESAVGSTTLTSFDMDGASLGTFIPNRTYETYVGQFFRRAPGVFDVVCYTGNGPGTQVINHNLGVTPELSIFKSRSGTGGWTVYNGATQFLRLNETTAGATDGSISPTTTSVTVSSSLGFGFNAAGVTYVAYLFATLPGISKVGSYTGTGTTQVIDCGFTTGARFVLIKRTNSTGDWFVYDTVRGIVSGNDPYLLLNSTSAEVTNTDYIDPANSGFEISSTAPAGINANGGTFIFLAVS